MGTRWVQNTNPDMVTLRVSHATFPITIEGDEWDWVIHPVQSIFDDAHPAS